MRLPESVGAPLVGALPSGRGTPCGCPPNLDAIALFSLPLRAPSRTKKGFLRGPPWTKKGFLRAPRAPPWTKKGFLRAPSRPSADKRCCRCSPCPFAPLPQKKVFFVALRGQKVLVAVLRAPAPSVDKKGVLRGPWTKKGFLPPLRAPPRTKGVAVAVLRCPSAALRGQKKVFFAPLRAPSRTKKVFFLPLRVGYCGVRIKMRLP